MLPLLLFSATNVTIILPHISYNKYNTPYVYHIAMTILVVF